MTRSKDSLLEKQTIVDDNSQSKDSSFDSPSLETSIKESTIESEDRSIRSKTRERDSGNSSPVNSTIEAQDVSPDLPQYVEYSVDNRKDNALERCKRKWQMGIYELDELLETCRNDPDSILTAYRELYAEEEKTYKTDGNCFTCEEYTENQYPSIRQTHGEKFGDPKYHYLMVDASTSITFFDISLQQGIMRKKQSEMRTVSVKPEEETHSFTAKPEEEMRSFSVRPEEEMHSPSVKPEEEMHSISVKSEEEIHSSVKPKTEIHSVSVKPQEEEKSQDTSDKPDDLVIVKKSADTEIQSNASLTNIGLDIDPHPLPEQEYHKRYSGVSYNEMINNKNTTKSTGSDSLDKVVLKATARADKFRHTVNVKKQYSLLGDIVREEKGKSQDSRKSSISENKSVETSSTSSKRYFRFFKNKPKKNTDELTKNDDGDDMIEEELEEKLLNERSGSNLDTRKLSIDSYRRRSPPVGNSDIINIDSNRNRLLSN